MTLHISKLFFGVFLISLYCYSARGQLNATKGVEPLIVGGEDATPHEYPFMVSIRYHGQHICGGSIIDASRVVTAGHCAFDSNLHRYTLLAGAHDFSDFSEPHHQARNVKSMHIHEDFNNAARMDSDICIFHTDTPFVINEWVKPIKISEQNPEAGETLIVAGWGLTEDEGDPSSTLKKVDVSVIDQAKCEKDYDGTATITPNMICAAEKGKDSCQGDSGGPLFTKEDPHQLDGIVSFGMGCADPSFPGVYTRVPNFKSWIDGSTSKDIKEMDPLK